MAPVVLTQFPLNVDMDTFVSLFWMKTKWYEDFLANKLSDLSINVGEWGSTPENPSMHTRTICSYHPSKISFPGLPSHAEVKPHAACIVSLTPLRLHPKERDERY
jgi:hypothetical protein